MSFYSYVSYSMLFCIFMAQLMYSYFGYTTKSQLLDYYTNSALYAILYFLFSLWW